MRLWRNTDEAPEGKFLVKRRDGTIPEWPYFVLGARDPAAPAALLAYADKAEEIGLDPAYVRDIRALAMEFESYRQSEGEGNPDGRPHRKDDPAVIAELRKTA